MKQIRRIFLKKRLGLLLCAAAVCACETQGGPEIEIGVAQDEVVFGDDNRIEYGAITDSRSLVYADATAALFTSGNVSCSGDSCDLSTSAFTYGYTSSGNVTLCDNEPYKGQQKGAFCSAFLVGPDVFATAGHCLADSSGTFSDCSDVKVVFGFTADANGENEQTTVSTDNVYTCQGTPVGEYVSGGADYAVFRVDRIVEDRIPMVVKYSGDLVSDNEQAVIGHPDGLPLKFADDGWIKVDDSSNPDNFYTSADAFAGNSGSPIVDMETGVVTGIHVRRPYYHYVVDGSCAARNMCSATSGCSPYWTTPWAAETRMTLAATEGDIPLHPALTTVAVL